MMDDRIADALKAGAQAVADGFRWAIDLAIDGTLLALKFVFGLWVLQALLRLLLAVTE